MDPLAEAWQSGGRGVTLVIPTLNEAATLGTLLERSRDRCERILVMDGGSTDGTVDVAINAGVDVEVVAQQGKGRAIRRSLRLVETPVTVFMDADGSHDPEDIARLVAPVASGMADMAVGCRWTGGSDELHGDMNKWLRRTGSRVLISLVNLRFGSRLTDMQNGFRALRTDAGRRIGLRSNDFTIEQEMVMKFLAAGFHVVNVPAHEYARQGGTAKLDLSREWFRFGTVVLRHLLNLERPTFRAGRRR